MRYKFFYEIKSRKNPYKGRFTSLADIPIVNFDKYITESKLQHLYDFMDLPDDPLKRKDEGDLTLNLIETIARKGKSSTSNIEINPIQDVFDQVITNEPTNADEQSTLLENLILYRVSALRTNYDLQKIEQHGGLLNSSFARLIYKNFDENQKFSTAKVIMANDPDILVLQEVENMHALTVFNDRYLDKRKLRKQLGTEYNKLNRKYRSQYPYQYLLDSHDPRLIDVGIFSRYPIISVKTHQFEKSDVTKNKRRDWKWLFSRDCLEVIIGLEDENGKSLFTESNGQIKEYDYDEEPRRILTPKAKKTITIFANHFKSRIGQDKKNPEKSDPWIKREQQAIRIKEILQERYLVEDELKGDFVVAGDFNDGYDSGALKPLLDSDLWNIVEDAGEGNDWTYYYHKDKALTQFDYLLLSPDLKKKNPDAVPIIERRGLAIYNDSPYEELREGERFEGIGGRDTEASDHCGVFVDLEI